MIDAEKREKVIAGLEAHANPKACETCAGEDCPYYNSGGSYTEVTCSSFLAADALALLKEQEARVMSFNELKFDTVYWIELKDVMPWPVAMAKMCGNPENLVFVDYHGDKWDVSKYRIKEGGWRCWTSRPSEQQMRDTPWKGEEESK